MYFVYILKSLTKNRFYIGSSEDVGIRFKYHNSGKVKSTKPFRPWIIIHIESYDNKFQALKRERQIKAYKGGNAFKLLIRNKI